MKKDKKSLATLVGAGIVTSLAAGAVSAAANPFTLTDLSQGYTVAEATTDAAAKKPEMKCGAEMMKGNAEMKCGAGMMGGSPAPDKKATEAKCAGMKMDKPATPAAPAAPAAPTEAPKAQ